MFQFALFSNPPQKRIRNIAVELHDKMIELRRSGSKVRAEGQDVVVDGARMSLRDFRRLYRIPPLTNGRNRQ